MKIINLFPGYKLFYTADDEEPNCLQCDAQDSCLGKHCGPEYGWSRYYRTVNLDAKKLEELAASAKQKLDS